jgi:hypothetical protein
MDRSTTRILACLIIVSGAAATALAGGLTRGTADGQLTSGRLAQLRALRLGVLIQGGVAVIGGWPDHWIGFPPLVHEFLRSIVEERKPWIDEVTAANWTAAGICALRRRPGCPSGLLSRRSSPASAPSATAR